MSIKILNGIDVDNGVLYTDTANNRVGIGTASPDHKLDVDGGAQFNTNTGTTPFYITRLGGTSQALSIKVMDDNVRFESIQDEAADNYGGFDFRMDGGVTEPDFVIRKNAGSPILNVKGDGNVGIGTTSPGEKLEVAGNIKIQSGGSSYDSNYISMVGSRAIFGYDGSISSAYMRSSDTSKPLVFGSGSSEFMRIVSSSGNVGIGTTSPDRRLHVRDTAIVTTKLEGTSQGSLLDLVNSNASQTYNGLRFTQGTTSKMAVTHIADGTTKGYVQIGNSWGAGSEILVVDGRTSRVGIGTTSPSSKLHIYDVAPTLKLQADLSVAPCTISFDNSSGTQEGSLIHNTGSNTFRLNNVSGNSRLNLDSYSAAFSVGTSNLDQSGVILGATTLTLKSNFSTALTCDMAGKVGIGTTSPTDKLTVQDGNIRLNSTSTYPTQGLYAYANNSSPNMGGISWHQNPGFIGSEWTHYKRTSPYTLARIRLIGDASSGGMFVNLNNSDVFTIKTSTGNAGIGVTNPSEKLEVNGAVKATATTDAYKGYIKQNVISYGAEKVENSNYYFTSYNTTATVTSAQAYNRMVAAYDGRVKKVYVRHGGGSTPTATAVNFKKHVNNVTSATTYAATVANTASTNMTAYYEFADSDFTFNAGDLIGLLYQTTEAFGTSKTMGGVAITITLEYNIT